jgi:phosphotransferase system  glucose/maltose/N-acetylglucosamine-specific IIC component
MFRRKLLFALAAITAALAFAVPVVSASAATTPGAQSMLCTLLNQQVLFAGGNSTLASLLASVLTYMHC